MSMEEFGDLFFVARDVRQKAFELLRHRAKHIHVGRYSNRGSVQRTGRRRTADTSARRQGRYDRQIPGSLADGSSFEQILEDYPSLTEDQLRAVVAFAAASAKEDLPTQVLPAAS